MPFFLEFSIVLLLFRLCSANIFCSEQYCQSYREQKGCPVLSTGCQIQNETHNGEVFPAADPCNCCNVCLENIREGQYCTIGSIDAAPPLYACGPGLKCVRDQEDEDYKCQRMTDTPCFQEQIEFDKKYSANETGSYMQRPNCDGDGNYRPIKCHPGQTCFCVDEEGKRIFGEAPHSTYTELTMKCECSRLNDKLSKLLPSRYPVITARCLEDGSFDPMQCMGDSCTCVDQSTGFPVTDTFNATEIGFKNLPCYNKTIHRSWLYLHDCEIIQDEYIEQIQTSEAEGFSVINFKGQLCQPDGWFLPVQTNSTHKYCGDKYGRQIGDYSAPKKSAKNMNCLCARTIDLTTKDHTSPTWQCCSNGNFKPVHCHLDKCYCVDENGLQTTKEVDQSNVSSLPCYSNIC